MQVGGRGEGFVDAGHLEIHLVVHPDDFVHRVSVTEIFTCYIGGEEDRVRVVEGCFRVAFEEGDVEDVEEVGIGEEEVLFSRDRTRRRWRNRFAGYSSEAMSS